MSTVTLEEAQARLPQLIEALAPGETLIILRDQQPVAILIAETRPSQQPEQQRKPSMGMFADRNVSISFEEIEEASREACRNFPRDFPEK